MKVKICCISSIEEAEMAIQAGATELGLVGPMPSGPGTISLSMIAEIAQTIPQHINTFFLTSERDVNQIVRQHKKVNTSTIQIVDSLAHGTYDDIRSEIPDIQLVQVIHVIDQQSIYEAQNVAEKVDFILLDSGNPNKKIKELGGTGRTHNWEVSKKIVEKVEIPVFLAGGLNPSNIRKAIEHVNPYGVDLCSGVRTEGKLNSHKLTSFFTNV